ncbi:hypothetical protein MRO89_05655 [Dickeya dianthicola]|uniref:hypothetical protein n=1 Tax=Dickeya dianthicola TaxID=204039 RepID=UPI001F61C6BF|nr:hypothetical protein [Dickeya dianthicola]MCI4185453.1 hypothetical protein [Dickeya dianthicola]
MTQPREPLTQRSLQVQTLAGKHRSAALSHFIAFIIDALDSEHARLAAEIGLEPMAFR